MTRDGSAAILRGLGTTMWAGLLIGYSVDGKPLGAPAIALVLAGLVLVLRRGMADPQARILLGAAAVAGLGFAVAGILAWVHGRLKVSVEVGLLFEFVGLLAYAAALRRCCRANNWLDPLRHLDRAVVSLAIAVALAVGMMAAVRIAHIDWDPSRRPTSWPNEYLQGRRQGLAIGWWSVMVPWLVAGTVGTFSLFGGHRALRRGLQRPIPEPAERTHERSVTA